MERAVLYRHVLRNAAIPVVTVVALQVGHLMGGAIVTETVFAYPGMGRFAVQAIANRDFPVVQAYVLVVGAFVLAINFVADLTYMYLNPLARAE
jgi:peptide/nickel transport system permease protein